MTTKGVVAVALAVWMTGAALLGLSVSAAPNHNVGGGVFGPGGIRTAGTGNAANEATFVYYSTNQPTFAVLSGTSSFTPADGTNQTYFLMDVGGSWNWNDGDITVAIVETIRGVNGWPNTNMNYTTSMDAVMHPVNGTTDLGDGTLELLPPLTLTAGGGYVNVVWTKLADAQGNIASYHLYTAGGPGGPWSSLATVLQTAPGAFNNTGISAGRHCYSMGVNYQRDQSGGVYETTGRSEPICANVTAAAPRIVSTTPANGATGVLLNQNIIINFDQAIDHTGHPFSVVPVPDPGNDITSWTNGDTTATTTHNAFTQCTSYTVTVTAQNAAGQFLQPPISFSFQTTCPNPIITVTNPLSGAFGVRRTGPNVVVDFNKAMKTTPPGAVTVTPNNGTAWPCAWSNGDMRCTITAALAVRTYYYVAVTGTDALGAALVTGPVPNPFGFWSNEPPTNVVFQAPGAGVCASGGSSLDVSWTMSDRETPTTSLQSWLNYTFGANTVVITNTPISGSGSPVTYTWTPVPSIDGTIQIWLRVVDGGADFAGGSSANVLIDSTAPTVLTTSTPADQATGVPTDATVTIRFSEAMHHASTEAAISFSPAVAGPTFTWSTDSKNVTVAHPAFVASTPYTLTVAVGAHDACTPGTQLSGAKLIHFTTGTGRKKPSAPTSVHSTSKTDTAITLVWTAPGTWTDGSTLLAADITEYRVYRSPSSTCDAAQLTSPVGTVTGTTTSYTDSGLQAETNYNYCVSAVAGGTEGEYGALTEKTTVSQSGFPWLIVIIAIIVVVLLIVGFLLLRRRGPAAAPPKGAGPSSRAPPEEAIAEEEPRAAPAASEDTGAEGGEKFIPCPNCGTMVKPTDAECFVCGAKL